MGLRGPVGPPPLFSATKILIFISVFTHSFVNTINAGNDTVEPRVNVTLPSLVHSLRIVVG